MSYQPLPNPLPVSGTVTADAGADLNTSVLALESGGNLAQIAAGSVMLSQQAQENAALMAIMTLLLAEIRLLNANFANCTPGGNTDASGFIS